jgi:hypothetical protein
LYHFHFILVIAYFQLQTLEIEIQRRKEALKEENKKRKEEIKQEQVGGFTYRKNL